MWRYKMKKLIGFLCMMIFSLCSVMCVHAATFLNYGDADGKIKYSRNRNTMINPQTFDINNVNKKYK